METTNHRVTRAGEVCDIRVNEHLMIQMFRSSKYYGPRNGLDGYMPAMVMKDDTVVWSFQELAPPKGQFGELFEYGEGQDTEFVIAIRDRVHLYRIFRVNDFTHAVPVRFGDTVVMMGGSNFEQLLDIKLAIANELGIECVYSAQDNEIINRRSAAERQAMEQRVKADERAKAQRRAEHEASIARILARKPVEAFAANGKRFFGIPIISDDEWRCLPNGKYCIQLKDDQPVEAFIVEKKNSKVKKTQVTEVSAHKPTPKHVDRTEMPNAMDQKSVTLRGETREVLVFGAMDDIKRLQQAGLNSGTWVAVSSKETQTLTVYAVSSTEIKTVGILKKNPQVQPSV